jgi:SAM-dependent methyltransferase
MIALAAQQSHGARIRYVQADLLAPLPFRDASHDLVLSSMVLMDLPRLDVVIGEFARVLVPRGALVFSITHPSFFCSDWVVVDGVKRHKAVGDYLTPRVEALSFWGRTLHFHRPLGEYVDELERHGLAIVSLKEPRPSEDQVRRHPEWERHTRVPSFLVARATRL